MTPAVQIILASASPRRRELLQQVGITARLQAADIDESQNPGEPVLAYVQRLALEKARAVCGRLTNPEKLPVLAADTIVVVDDCVLGKPESRQHAKKILQQLSARRHTVHTSVAVICGQQERQLTSSSQVEFKRLEDAEIDAYLATGEADDKAGAYAIQGIAALFVKSLHGSFSGVMGLPLYETGQLLEQCAVWPLYQLPRPALK